jgi:ubiquitin-activating enzyme E1
VGCGAIGCEYLKTMGLMGIGSNKGLITTVDGDSVSVSNLCRQFLFSDEDIGQPKVDTATKKVKSYIPNMNLQSINTVLTKDRY